MIAALPDGSVLVNVGRGDLVSSGTYPSPPPLLTKTNSQMPSWKPSTPKAAWTV